MKKPPESHVSPGDFFTKESEKTKLNWFLFEFAAEFERRILRNTRLRAKLRRKKVRDQRIADLCVHYAKTMKPQIVLVASGRKPQIRIGYEEIEAFLPEVGDRLVDRILTEAYEAWDAHTEMCVSCPTRCVSERNRRAPMFDDPDYYQ